ncbi:site-specific integrase [Enterovibrio sp. ZSDZ42]|uniref:Site-specific integrase n=1 Tax=Enterovibrio gelatinilyticus TaxID=2899819 RepID=A0ABT5R0K6_9GAMM|nr:site-specific integrase [Enterovibrio sp. ZSDZ42]MDD1793805.1 site-specific integrase [Enterovibrio sp. ZSDZ42]
MATKAIEQVNTQRGTRYKARVRVTSGGKTLEQCCKTFDTYQEADKWATKAKQTAERKGVEGLREIKMTKSILIGDVIEMVLNNEPTSNHLGRSKEANLRMLLTYPIAKLPADSLTAQDLFEHCKLRRETVKAQTVSHDISNLCTALKDANTFYGIPTDRTAFDSARSSLQRHGYIARSAERSRRLKSGELEQISGALKAINTNSKQRIPLQDIMEIAVDIGLRLGEILKLHRDDICKKTRTITVRDRKHPKKNKRHTDILDVSDKLLDLLLNQPEREDNLLFPYSSKAIGYKWRKLTKDLGIVDLRFHDLRTEAACRMFEAGLSAIEISKITGHRDINVLNNHYLPLCASLPKAA